MGPFKKCCERLGLTTEADELDWIMHQCDCPILFYDKMQVVGPSGIDVQRFSIKMKEDRKNRLAKYYKLLTQMRVRGGNDYIGYIESLLQCNVQEKKQFDNYEFALFDHFAAFQQKMYEKEQEYGLTRMIAGYSWEWISKKNSSAFDIEIEGIRRKWNHCTEGWVHTEKAINEVGCIHSIQGYDLNYAFVVLGKEISYDAESNSIVVYKNNYFDDNGKKTATYDELLEYIKDIYYVLLSRGIRGTYVYVCDEKLKRYLEQYIDVIK